ncbi:DUF616 domain-containing protein [Klebsiella grimontii]|uniref:DUF616 domain-containing protein n=1 Tax=Klebsiella grimontii TaxID=2058152 RepID=A0ABD7AG01_9ENTR|nr:glycosyltransferase domain-containing protein [Klebsiella grimontii]QLO51763.1 DUF616 domain-containing protein [Klebsiella grimontii]
MKVENKNKYVIYTALFGDYDDLIDPVGVDYKCDFICFTDQKNIISKKWKVIYVDTQQNSVLKNREYKFLPHKFLNTYQVSMYIDANIKILNDPYYFIERYSDSYGICVPKHFERECIYDEITQCVNLNKISKEEGNVIFDILKADNYPSKNGLGENNIIIRRHMEPEIVLLMESWWETFRKGAKRDQLTLLYLAWKNNIPVYLMDETSRNKNKYFRYNLHKGDKKLPFLKRTFLYVKANRFRSSFFDSICNIHELITKVTSR